MGACATEPVFYLGRKEGGDLYLAGGENAFFVSEDYIPFLIKDVSVIGWGYSLYGSRMKNRLKFTQQGNR